MTTLRYDIVGVRHLNALYTRSKLRAQVAALLRNPTAFIGRKANSRAVKVWTGSAALTPQNRARITGEYRDVVILTGMNIDAATNAYARAMGVTLRDDGCIGEGKSG